MGIGDAKSLVVSMFSSDECCLKESLIALEDHPVFNLAVLIQIQPCPIRALSTLIAVIEDPLSLFVPDCGLHLRKELVFYPNVTIGCAPYQNILVVVGAAAKEDIGH